MLLVVISIMFPLAMSARKVRTSVAPVHTSPSKVVRHPKVHHQTNSSKVRHRKKTSHVNSSEVVREPEMPFQTNLSEVRYSEQSEVNHSKVTNSIFDYVWKCRKHGYYLPLITSRKDIDDIIEAGYHLNRSYLTSDGQFRIHLGHLFQRHPIRSKAGWYDILQSHPPELKFNHFLNSRRDLKPSASTCRDECILILIIRPQHKKNHREFWQLKAVKYNSQKMDWIFYAGSGTFCAKNARTPIEVVPWSDVVKVKSRSLSGGFISRGHEQDATQDDKIPMSKIIVTAVTVLCFAVLCLCVVLRVFGSSSNKTK